MDRSGHGCKQAHNCFSRCLRWDACMIRMAPRSALDSAARGGSSLAEVLAFVRLSIRHVGTWGTIDQDTRLVVGRNPREGEKEARLRAYAARFTYAGGCRRGVLGSARVV